MNKILLLLAVFIGWLSVVGRNVQAETFATFTSSAVVIATGPASNNLEITKVRVSSGAAVHGALYLALVSSNPLRADGLTAIDLSALGLAHGVTFDGVNNGSKYPIRQYLIPPIVLHTTVTVSVSGLNVPVVNPSWIEYDLTDSVTGEGIDVNNDGIVAFKLGTDAGTVISIGYRQRRSSIRR